MSGRTSNPTLQLRPDVCAGKTFLRGLAYCCIVLLLQIASPMFADEDHETQRSQLLTVDGEVVELGAMRGEGDLTLVMITLSSSSPGQQELRLLLAPETILEEIGFSVSRGDRLRARVFPDPLGFHLVHRIWNIENRLQIRLRTLYKAPVWDNEGEWQGGKREDCPYRPWKEEVESGADSELGLADSSG